MAQSPEHRQTLLSMASDWNDMDLLSSLMAAQPKPSASFVSRFLPTGSLLAGFMARLVSVPRYALASLLVVGLGVALIQWQLTPGHMDTRFATVLGEQATHRLVDGSVLRLNTDSLVMCATQAHNVVSPYCAVRCTLMWQKTRATI